MPQVAQGDIFSFAESVDLLIVFGHRGFNEINVAWDEFRKSFQNVDAMGEPFTSFDAEPHEYAPGKFIVTVAEESNHGMSDDRLRRILENYLGWAIEKRLSRVATNGIKDPDHSGDTAIDCASNDRRAGLILDLASDFESNLGLEITLASLSPVFVRN